MVTSVAFDPQGETLASGSQDGTVKLWDVPGGKLATQSKRIQFGAHSVVFDPRSGALASGGVDRMVKLWEVRSGKRVRTVATLKDFVWSVAFDPKHGSLASVSYDDAVKLWKARTGTLLRMLGGHGWGVHSLAFDSRGRMLVGGGNAVTLWDAQVAGCCAPSGGTEAASWVSRSIRRARRWPPGAMTKR